MQKYTNKYLMIPQDKRGIINKKVLSVIKTGQTGNLSKEDVFNAYTGIGGLHNLNRKDFANYHEFSNAKKEFEKGQFFTPHSICQKVAELVNPRKQDLVADITCGIGGFFNYFEESNCYGCELDVKAHSVAKYLYPLANIERGDFRFYKPNVKVDYVIGNPPFNLRLQHPKTGYNIDSQLFFFEKSAEILKPAGLLLCIVPTSFMNDETFQKSQIEAVESDFYYIGQYKLPNDAFMQMGVANFDTKVMAFQKKAESIDGESFEGQTGIFLTYEQLKAKVGEKVELKNSVKLKIHQEILKDDEDKAYEYKVKKYVYELKTHKSLSKYLDKAIQYIAKQKNQTCPNGVDYEKWYKNHRITKKMVLSYLKRTIKKQSQVQKDEIRFVKTRQGVKLKAYSNKTKRQLSKREKIFWSFNDYCLGFDEIKGTKIPKQYKKLFESKKRAYELQNKPYGEVNRQSDIDTYLNNFSFLNEEKEVCAPNDIQYCDLGLLLQKRYSILAWQMGGGKTSAAYAWSKFVPQRNTFVVSTSQAIRLTWKGFLTTNKESFVLVESLKDLNSIKRGDFVLLTFHFVSKYKRQLMKLVKKLGQKANLVFDESDEITNYSSKKTKSVIAIFRRLKRKLLTTGTTTRNNIAELYAQFELLYNNSVNMISHSAFCYVQERTKEGTEIKSKENKYWNRPFPPYNGQAVFKNCFNPSKSTVFGIQKNNQDLYNEKDLSDLIKKTIITRKFREIAGDKYRIINKKVYQSKEEKAVYKKIINDLDSILKKYFKSTGNSRKDSLLKIIRQLQLLIEATSTPQLFDFYQGNGVPNKAYKNFELIESKNEKFAIGCTSIKCTKWYYKQLKKRYKNREVFLITGSVSFKKRKKIIKQFQATKNGILVCTQQSLKSSVNIPECDNVIIESLQWNIPRIEQFFFRFIRFDSRNLTNVYFVNYHDTIEVNLLALLMAKERLNDYVKTLDYKENSDIYDTYDIDLGLLDNLITKQKDEQGNVSISWGQASSK